MLEEKETSYNLKPVLTVLSEWCVIYTTTSFDN